MNAITKLRDLCNATIKRINTTAGTQTPGFETINALLKACDDVFAEFKKPLPADRLDPDGVVTWKAFALPIIPQHRERKDFTREEIEALPHLPYGQAFDTLPFKTGYWQWAPLIPSFPIQTAIFIDFTGGSQQREHDMGGTYREFETRQYVVYVDGEPLMRHQPRPF